MMENHYVAEKLMEYRLKEVEQQTRRGDFVRDDQPDQQQVKKPRFALPAWLGIRRSETSRLR
ncbi:hypothetical protein [Cohnella thermotolerans]|uniref:hypothetical protein n=1 Tax=Cohnella thermotolerans TaxID=329858 RepID=UPI000418E543|nr:hypothetical protein [Cohnella thermotolerans]